MQTPIDISPKELGRLRRARRGDRAAQEQRRMYAAKLFEQGVGSLQVAVMLGATQRSTTRWKRAWIDGGAGALAAAETSGSARKLSAEQVEIVRAGLLKGALAHGYSTDLWTLARTAEIVRTLTGVTYHPNYMWAVLKRMGFSPQRPRTRATERCETQRGFFLQVLYPEVKKGL